jgi:cytochrome P450
MPKHEDPFRDDRERDGIKFMDAEGAKMPLVLRLQDVRRTCKDLKHFSNDDPFMIVPHSEESVRSVRQLPIETDPPDHTEYRALVEPVFRRPNDPAYQVDMQELLTELVLDATRREEVEIVREFSLPLQSRGLTRLLGVEDWEANLWISWGTHVFKDTVDGGDSAQKGAALEEYIEKKFKETEGSDADDFFSLLNRIEFRGRQLTQQEKHGFANMAFAGGRDTVIHTVSSIIVYLAEHPEALGFLRESPNRITTATEEFVRYVSPLTAIARKCPHATKVLDLDVEAGGRIGLCWPSANRDTSVFQNADEVVLDRAPNPHVGFGFGIHNCLGSHQARLIIRTLLKTLCDLVDRIELIDAIPEVEHESSFSRQVGYASARVKFCAKADAPA